MEQIKPDVVHIQHEYGLYLTHGGLEGESCRSYFDSSSTDPLRHDLSFHLYSLDRPEAIFTDVSLRLLDSAIVHAEVQKLFLPYNLDWIPHNVHVISHGAKESYPILLQKSASALLARRSHFA